MPRVSEHFSLGRTQAALDFVDVDVVGDTNLFIDPRAIERLDTEWGQKALDLVRDFFERVLAATKDGRESDGLKLLAGLGEPNQTHLGFSSGQARGSGVGRKLSKELWNALSKSEARKTGLLQHLEDTVLLVEAISVDRVSDITTNIIRESLIDYTREQTAFHRIPTEQVGAGPTWDYQSGRWIPEEYAMLPTTPSGTLLLVPKIIVRRRLDFDPGEYYRKYILEHLMDVEYAAGSSLVQTLKSGKPKVYKKDVDAKAQKEYRGTKRAIIDVTLQNPSLLDNYRSDKTRSAFIRKPLELTDFSNWGSDPPNWPKLLKSVTSLKPGVAAATKYHRNVEALLTALFYPALISPKIEREIDEGRKRVDIQYTNAGFGGFFEWIQRNYPPQPHVYVECKNYTDDLGNKELDQITGRFNLTKGGSVGLLVNRAFADKPRFLRRCRDAAMKNRGYVLPLDDDDLTTLTLARRDEDDASFFAVLSSRFAQLID